MRIFDFIKVCFGDSKAIFDPFRKLQGYDIVFLAGPHRAGTTIAARMIQNDLGLYYYEEEDASHFLGVNSLTNNDLNMFFENCKKPMIFRAPKFSSVVHKYTNLNLIVAMLFRPIDEIIASQKRIKWGFEKQELENYPSYNNQPISKVKYDYWHKVQKDVLGNQGIELNYYDLKEHPMWLSKEKRTEFFTRQYRLNDFVGQPHLNSKPLTK